MDWTPKAKRASQPLKIRTIQHAGFPQCDHARAAQQILSIKPFIETLTCLACPLELRYETVPAKVRFGLDREPLISARI